MMKKYLFDLRTIVVVVGLMFVLIHVEVVFGQGTKITDSNLDTALEPRDQHLLKTEEKKKRFEKRKGEVLENIREKRALLNDFESCIKSANSREDLKSCRNKNKKRMEVLHTERKEMREKMKTKREKLRKEMGALRAQEKEIRKEMKEKMEKLRKEIK